MTWKTKITMKRIYLTTQFMMAQSTWTQFWKPLRFVQKAITSMLMHGSYPDLVRFKIIQEMWFNRCQVKMILCLGLRDTQGLLWRLGSVSKWALWSTETTTTQVFFKICRITMLCLLPIPKEFLLWLMIRSNLFCQIWFWWKNWLCRCLLSGFCLEYFWFLLEDAV